MKKALRDLSRHWRKKVLHAWLTIKHPTGDTSHGDIVWGCSRTRCLSTIPFLQQHPRGENQDDLPHRPCLAQVLHPIHPSIPGTARAPLLLQLRLILDDELLIILPDYSESKPQCLAEQSPPRHLQGKPPSFKSCQGTQCKSAASSWEGGMWMCSRSRAVSTRYSGRPVPHTDCSLCQHRHWEASASLLCTLFFGCWVATTVGTIPAGERKWSWAQDQGGQRKRTPPLAQPCSSREAAKLKARMGWSSLKGAMKQPGGSLAGAKKIKSSRSTEELLGLRVGPCKTRMEQ